jgi:dTDP-4-amino-4,6-dideoxygalactose transaminase
MKIKFLDLNAQNEEIRQDVECGMAEMHRNTAYIGGPAVAAFEKNFADYLGVRRVIGVGSGTDALRLSLLALGIGPGDEVITVPMTFIATAEAIYQTGACPVFVDVDPDTGNMSVKALRLYLEAGRWKSPNGPKAILPVHLYGTPAPAFELNQLAAEYGLVMVEDACQAHGARLSNGNGGWVRAGTVGAAGCFSFYPGKNLGAWGEAGAIATNDDELAERAIRLRDHGRISHYAHSDLGYNARLDTIQAVVLSAKLKRLEAWNARRREIAAAYSRLLRDGEAVRVMAQFPGAESCYHLFVIRSDRRDAIRNALLASNIDCGIHYPLPLHLQPACRELGYKHGDFPASEMVADTVLSLPMHPHLTEAEVMRVAEVVRHSVEQAEHPVSGKIKKDLFAGRQYGKEAASTPPPRGD